MRFKKWVSRLLSARYETLFKRKAGREVRQLAMGVSFAGTGILLAALLTFIFSILGARVLGPENFGNLSLITAMGAILGVPMVLSVVPMIKYAAGERNQSVQARIIATSYIEVLLFTAASVSFFLLFAPQLSRAFAVPNTIFIFSVSYAVFATFFSLATGSLRIFFRMRAYAIFVAAQSTILLAIFITFISLSLTSWQSAAYSWYISYAIISLLMIIYLRDAIKLHFDKSWAKTIANYALHAAPGGVATASLGVDRVLINAFTTMSSVGIYNAYFAPSITIAIVFWGIFNSAFFPYASRSRDRYTILLTINKAAPYFAIAFVPLFLFLQWIAFIFYGHQYPFSWTISLLFAIAATAAFFYQCYSWLVASEGVNGAKANTFSSIIALSVLIALDVVLIPLVGISGAAIALFVAYLAAVLYLISKRSILREI